MLPYHYPEVNLILASERNSEPRPLGSGVLTTPTPFTPERHFAFEDVAWYWHFVDVVWLFLFIFIYCIKISEKF